MNLHLPLSPPVLRMQSRVSSTVLTSDCALDHREPFMFYFIYNFCKTAEAEGQGRTRQLFIEAIKGNINLSFSIIIAVKNMENLMQMPRILVDPSAVLKKGEGGGGMSL